MKLVLMFHLRYHFSQASAFSSHVILYSNELTDSISSVHFSCRRLLKEELQGKMLRALRGLLCLSIILYCTCSNTF